MMYTDIRLANQTLETNCRPASPLGVWRLFGRAVYGSGVGFRRQSLSFALGAKFTSSSSTMKQIDLREGARRQHRAISLFAVIQCWLRNLDGVAFQRSHLERLLGLALIQA